jgi:multiple antibiotic resistance protein
LPVLRFGGGPLVAATGWRMLCRTGDDGVYAVACGNASENSYAGIICRSFVPITFPNVTGHQIPTTPVLYLAGAINQRKLYIVQFFSECHAGKVPMPSMK